ncbi:hypothetical protein F4859DRAFT_524207 [Xylaria cf. heliscus]|nr:hypothetical protein F4859DRAFT_524207 [Xylaria cf. heliscus]
MESDDSTGSPPDHYARDNHLTIDSQIDPFSLVLQINDSIPQPTSDVGSSGLTTDTSLPRLHLPTVDLQEQLEVPKESTDLLARALQYHDIHSNEQCQMPLAQYEAHKRLIELKVDPPALSSDPDYDCCELAKSIWKQRQPNLRRDTIPLERRNIAKDEGLEFPGSVYQFRRKLDRIMHHEKLDVPKEAMSHLAQVIQDDWPDSEKHQFLEEAKPRRTVCLACTFVRNLAATPPLSPYMEHEEPFIPDIGVCEVPVVSDLSSMLSDDLRAAESVVMQKELENDVSLILDTGTLRSSPSLDSPGLVTELPRIHSIRMESPPSPMTSPFQYPNEGNNIPALLKSMDIDHVLSNSESLGVGDLQADGADNILDIGLETVMQESAATVLRSIEQEHISIAEAIARVEVPSLDFSIPDPEWKILPMDTLVHIKWLYESYNLKTPPCPRNSRADSKLRWLPFLKNIDPQTLTKETIDCGRDPLKSINIPNIKKILTSVDCIWKRQGFAILCELESEECLEEIMSPMKVMSDIASLARKRGLENNVIDASISYSSGSDSSIDLVAPSRYKRQTNLLPSMESNSAVSTLLSNHISFRTAKRRKQDRSSYFTSTAKTDVKAQLLSVRVLSQSEENSSGPSKILGQLGTKAALQTPYPKLDVPNAPTKLIKGLALSRKLFFGLEQLYPNAEIIERDFDRWNTIAWGQYSVSSSTLVLSLAAEADVIVSPATGIVVTTLLKVIQKPPPGYRGQTSIRERISCMALRYERLIVLVSEANAVDDMVHDLTSPETAAYAEFIGFAAGLDSKVEVFYVGGGEATLLKWLVSFAARHAPEATKTQEHLIQDETHWEIFLRCAGFNAYAAQAILGRLRLEGHNTIGESECSKPGLAAFLTMADAERLQRFRDIMGGESVINRVNKTLATKWR